ncbi:MAG: zinc ribbon domain-containing protein [Bacteroidaceae bacterium]|nr:zinc ribbon domain-containing protein [Bacteroidaceae bacterium]
MALIECPLCGENISDKATTCPHCGYVVTVVDEQKATYKPQKQSRNWGKLIVLIIVAMIAVFAWNKIKRNESKKAEYTELIYQKSGIKLRGDYTVSELASIAHGGKAVIMSNNDLINRIYKQEGLTITDIPDF